MVIVNVDGVPVHPFAVGVTVMVEVAGVVPLLIAVNAPISPLPLIPNPTSTDELHEKAVPATGPVKLIAGAKLPLQ